MSERRRACIICGEQTSTLHSFPKSNELKKKWQEFVFGDAPLPSSAVVCSLHFNESDFVNYGAFTSGFSSKLSLKPGAVPSRGLTTSSSQDVKLTTHTATVASSVVNNHPSHDATRHTSSDNDRLTLSRYHISTQTYPPDLSTKSTQVSMGTLGPYIRSKGTQTVSSMTSRSAATSTAGAPWEPGSSTPTAHQSKRPRLEEEETPEPRDSTCDPEQSVSDDSESSESSEISSEGKSNYIVCERNLMELFETCPVCSRVSEVKKSFRRGTFLSVHQKCHHCRFSRKWTNQPQEETSV